MDDTTLDWHLAGNDAIDSMNHFLGTLGSQPLVVRTNHWANPSASERMRVSVTGNVGIGTDDPRQGRLVIEDSAVPLALKETGQGPALGGLWRLALDGGVVRLDMNTAAAADFSSFSSKLAIKPDGSVGVGVANPAARLEVSGGDIRLEAGRTFYSPGRLHVNGEELLYVLNKGGMVVGKEWGGNGNLSVQGNLEVLSASNPIRLSSAWSGFPDPVTNRAEISNDTATYKTLMIVGNKSAGMGRRVSVWDRLEVNGNLSVTGVATKPGGGWWSASSDIRLKKNVKPLKGSLERLLRLRGVSFEWKRPEEQGNLTDPQMGLIAQEVEEVFPDWVDTDPSGHKRLSVRGFEAMTVEAFRELKSENEELAERVRTLESRILEGTTVG